MSNPYEVLGIPGNSSIEEVKKAYKKKVLLHHPDKGGSTEEFVKINKAYESITKGGNEENGFPPGFAQGFPPGFASGFPQGFPPFPFPQGFSEFTNFFKNTFTRKTPEIVHYQNVSLEDLCSRKVISLEIELEKPCECKTESKTENTCNDCQGKGVKTEVRSMGPLQFQTQIPCSQCKGQGFLNKGCEMCKGEPLKYVKTFTLLLTPAFQDGYRYVYSNQGSIRRNEQQGDFVVIVRHVPHPLFKLEGKNLVCIHSISLKQALCGFDISLTHPSGEKVFIEIRETVKPKYYIELENKGITQEGTLKIMFDITFPELNEQQKKVIGECLG
jgi:DnaJ homolog subfamily A member 2